MICWTLVFCFGIFIILLHRLSDVQMVGYSVISVVTFSLYYIILTSSQAHQLYPTSDNGSPAHNQLL